MKQQRRVDTITLKHWLQTPLIPKLDSGPYYFCNTPDCHVVYFSEDKTQFFERHHLRDRVSIKEVNGPRMVCYCFGITREMICQEIMETGEVAFAFWVEKEVKEGNCACEIRNPSGRCCLRELKEAENHFRKKRSAPINPT